MLDNANNPSDVQTLAVKVNELLSEEPHIVAVTVLLTVLGAECMEAPPNARGVIVEHLRKMADFLEKPELIIVGKA